MADVYDECLAEHFNSERIPFVMQAVYYNAGVSDCGYGYLSGGFGGGVEMKEYHAILWLRGYISGLGHGNKQAGHNLLKSINIYLQRNFQLESEKLPFINLDMATI